MITASNDNLSQFETCQDERVQWLMDELGLAWAVVRVNVADVDLRDNTFQTRMNAAKFEAGHASDYADKMKAGAVFPMVVLQQKSPGKYRVVCGRHRATAFAMSQNGRDSYMAYVVQGDLSADQLMALSARDNNENNGFRTSNGDTARMAANYLRSGIPLPPGVRKHKRAVIARVAAEFGANESTVNGNYIALLTEKRMADVNVPYAGLPSRTLQVLYNWTDCAAWPNIAAEVAANAGLHTLTKVLEIARKEKVDGAALLSLIREHVAAGTTHASRQVRLKDPVTVMLEHLALAFRDFPNLAPPSNISAELREEIRDMVAAIRRAHKQWDEQ